MTKINFKNAADLDVANTIDFILQKSKITHDNLTLDISHLSAHKLTQICLEIMTCDTSSMGDRKRTIMFLNHAYEAEQKISALETKDAENYLKLRTDDLTGLNNKLSLEEELNEQIEQISQRKTDGAVLFMMDLDGLKSVNDVLGHQYGDLIIQVLADTLRETFRDEDIVCSHLSGDEFMVLARNISKENAAVINKRVNTALDTMFFNYNGHEIKLGASSGAHLVNSTLSVQENMNIADQLMYQDKERKSGNRREDFETTLIEAKENLALRANL